MTTVAGVRTAVRREQVVRWLPWVALALIFAGAAWLLMWAGRNAAFFYDDWPYLLERAGWNPYTLLRPHNEHLQVFPLLLYKVLFETVGLHAHWVYRAALVALNLLTGLLLFIYARRRVGAWPALGLAACLVVMAPSWYNLLYSFQVNFVGAMAAGMGALLALDREDRRGDVLAAVLLVVSIGSSSVGFPFLIGAVVEVLWRRDWRRLWVVGVPIGLYLLWVLRYGEGNSVRVHNAPEIPAYVMDGADDAAGAITGYGLDVGLLLFWALVALVVREVAVDRVTPRLMAVVAMPLSLWALTALGRADMGVEADANRYLYAAGLFVALVAVEVGRRYAIPARVGGVICGLLLFGAVANANGVQNGGLILEGWSQGGKSAVTALEVAGPENVPADYRGADPTQGFIVAGPLYATIDRYDSTPGFTLDEVRDETPGLQRQVDETLARVLNLNVAPVDRDVPVGPEAPAGLVGSVVPAGEGCVRGGAGRFVVRVPPYGAIVRAGDAPVALNLRRFGSLYFEKTFATVDPGATGSLAIPVDRSSQPWLLEAKSPAGAVVCGVPVPG